MSMVVGTTGVVATVAAVCVLYFEQDRSLLARAFAGLKVTDGQIEQLSLAADNLEAHGSTDELRLLQLRKVMDDLGRDEEVDKIDNYVAEITPQTLEGLASRPAACSV